LNFLHFFQEKTKQQRLEHLHFEVGLWEKSTNGYEDFAARAHCVVTSLHWKALSKQLQWLSDIKGKLLQALNSACQS